MQAAVADGVITDREDRANASVAGQLLDTYLRAVAVEAEVNEQTELEERLEQLESIAKQSNGRTRPWE